MRLLLITNLTHPGARWVWAMHGGFRWGLRQGGHEVQVICNDAVYLGIASKKGPSGEPVARELL